MDAEVVTGGDTAGCLGLLVDVDSTISPDEDFARLDFVDFVNFFFAFLSY